MVSSVLKHISPAVHYTWASTGKAVGYNFQWKFVLCYLRNLARVLQLAHVVKQKFTSHTPNSAILQLAATSKAFLLTLLRVSLRGHLNSVLRLCPGY